MDAILYKIEQSLDGLSSRNQRIGIYLLENSRNVVWLSQKDLANAVGVSESTIMRFCKKFGVSNFDELKILISQNLIQSQNSFKDFESEDFKKNIGLNLSNQVITSLRDTYSILSEEKVMEAAELLYKAKSVMCAGIGASYLVAEDLTHKLLRLQKSVFTHYDVDLRKVAITQYTEQDLLIVVSYSGKKQEILDLANLAKKQNVPIIAFSRVGETPLSSIATITLEVAAFEHEYRVGALSSRISQLYLVDVLFYTFGLYFQEKAMERLRKTYKIINK